MVHHSSEEEPPIRRRFLSFSIQPAWTTKGLVYLIPLALVILAIGTNVVYGESYSTAYSSLVTLEPKTKLTALQNIDPYSPFIEESRDAEPIVTADLTPGELIMKKPSLASVDRSGEEDEISVSVPESAPRSIAVTHTVELGETLSAIAAKYDLSIGSIQVENKNLGDVDDLQPGDELRIPPADYDPTYIAKVLDSKKKTTLASREEKNRQVTVRGTSAARYGDGGEPAFRRPAGALGQNGYHSWAVDIPPSGGGGVYASADGVVVEVASGWNGGYGNMIVIDHGSGWQTLYAHLSDFNVSPGEMVGAGQVIGVMGATGRTYPKGAVHLHFEIRKVGNRLNPLNFIQ